MPTSPVYLGITGFEAFVHPVNMQQWLQAEAARLLQKRNYTGIY